MTLPRYYRARNSYCFFVSNVHLYVYVHNPHGRPSDGWHQTGITVKRRRRDTIWRTTAAQVAYKNTDALLVHWELVTHLSKSLKNGRIPLSKRYLRFKVCL